MTRLESQTTTRDTSQSHLCKISEPLIDKPSLFAYKEMINFGFVIIIIKIGANFLY